MVRMPRARRTGMTVFMAGWRLGAWKKAKRCVRREAAPSAGERSTGMPRASRTSAEPQVEVTARLPCLATSGSGGGGDEGGGGGDVEGAAGVGAGAAGVDQEGALGIVEWDGGGGGAHGVDEAGDFGGGGAAGGEGAEEGGEFEFGGFAAEDGLEELGGVGAGEGLAAFDDSFEIRLEGHWF